MTCCNEAEKTFINSKEYYKNHVTSVGQITNFLTKSSKHPTISSATTTLQQSQNYIKPTLLMRSNTHRKLPLKTNS